MDAGIALQVCPASNVALGVYPTLDPLRRLADAGATIALGADDPLLFGPRLAAQYGVARDVHGFDDAGLAALARGSVAGVAGTGCSAGPPVMRPGVDRWVEPPGAHVELDRAVDVTPSPSSVTL